MGDYYPVGRIKEYCRRAISPKADLLRQIQDCEEAVEAYRELVHLQVQMYAGDRTVPCLNAETAFREKLHDFAALYFVESPEPIAPRYGKPFPARDPHLLSVLAWCNHIRASLDWSTGKPCHPVHRRRWYS